MYSRRDIKKLDKLLDYLFKKQNKIIDNNTDLDYVSVTSKEIKDELSLNNLELNKYLQILWNRNTNSRKFINKENDRYWLMDLGIEFYYLGGFRREFIKNKLKKIRTYLSLFFGIIASLGVIYSIYTNYRDTKNMNDEVQDIKMGMDSLKIKQTAVDSILLELKKIDITKIKNVP